jgi:hypothetical protein
MEFTRYIPKIGRLPELRIFMCIECEPSLLRSAESKISHCHLCPFLLRNDLALRLEA